MREHIIDIRNDTKPIFSQHIKLGGTGPKGQKIGFNSYYMELDGKPFFGVMGEIHFSRLPAADWEDRIIKMKMCGINIVATYIFWIFHEEEKGIFEWGGDKDVKKFLELCKKHEMFVVLRTGPFGHGEVRNGALPDWLYGGPFEVRSNDPGYLFYVKRLYGEIGKQAAGLMYKDGGPVIGVQLENEYMHSAAAWEFSVGISNEWIPAGRDGDSHILKLKELAIEAGLDAPIYTCTGWGEASAPEGEVLALWGGYAYRPWLFFDDIKEHPATEEYIFQDYHNNKFPSLNYEPKYDPEEYPYACCEMGGGMQAAYAYRFTVPPESVDAMAIIKIAGGCNMIGYYMFCGGTNPDAKGGIYLNEHIWPKKSYDYQAPVREFGLTGESYKRLKRIHYFLNSYEKLLCPMKTILPQGAVDITPQDNETLRYAVRTGNGSGFLFMNNFQDHWEMKDHKDISVGLRLKDEILRIPENGGLKLAAGTSCILPFNLDLGGITLKYSTAQMITGIQAGQEKVYFFFEPQGMEAEYCFDTANISGFSKTEKQTEIKDERLVIKADEDRNRTFSIMGAGGNKLTVVTLTHEQSLDFWKVNLNGSERVIISNAALICDGKTLKLDWTGNRKINIDVFPAFDKDIPVTGLELKATRQKGIFTSYEMENKHKEISISVKNISRNRASVSLAKDSFEGLKNIMLNIDYSGDIGYAFINGKLIHDNFCNNNSWNIGLKEFQKELMEYEIDIYISPLKTGCRISSDSPMAARSEVYDEAVAEILSIKAQPVFEMTF
ncbi:beta-galactosidase [Ruminiclostridium cellobioparum]|uniref:beta-galactosidase n=1 Tax=Ruminiclostridium cellobioparum TaxID=29355 RepID=UPI0004810217|nr:beta-galactosidase [Ruminiclostridium cellobioparum]